MVEAGIVREANLEVGEVALLIELSGLQTERVDDVVDGLGTLLQLLGGILGGGVGTYKLLEQSGGEGETAYRCRCLRPA